MQAGLLYDGSEQSKKALKQALDLLHPHKDAILHVLTCVEKPETDPPYGYLPGTIIACLKVKKMDSLAKEMNLFGFHEIYQTENDPLFLSLSDPGFSLFSLIFHFFSLNFMLFKIMCVVRRGGRALEAPERLCRDDSKGGRPSNQGPPPRMISLPLFYF